MLRERAAQGADKRLRRARLADRDGMQPDEPPRAVGRVPAEALADPLAIARLRSPAPPEAQQRERKRQVKRQRVEESHASACRTSATPGVWPSAPTLRARAAP